MRWSADFSKNEGPFGFCAILRALANARQIADIMVDSTQSPAAVAHHSCYLGVRRDFFYFLTAATYREKKLSL